MNREEWLVRVRLLRTLIKTFWNPKPELERLKKEQAEEYEDETIGVSRPVDIQEAEIRDISERRK